MGRIIQYLTPEQTQQISGKVSQPQQAVLPEEQEETYGHMAKRLGAETGVRALSTLGGAFKRGVDLPFSLLNFAGQVAGLSPESMAKLPRPDIISHLLKTQAGIDLPNESDIREALLHPFGQKESTIPEEYLGYKGPWEKGIGTFASEVPSAIMEFGALGGMAGKAGEAAKALPYAKSTAKTLAGMKLGEKAVKAMGGNELMQALGGIVGGFAPEAIKVPFKADAALDAAKKDLYGELKEKLARTEDTWNPQNVAHDVKILKEKRKNRVDYQDTKADIKAKESADAALQYLDEQLTSSKQRRQGKRLIATGAEAEAEPVAQLVSAEGKPIASKTELTYQTRPITELMDHVRQINEQLSNPNLSKTARSDLMDMNRMLNKEVKRAGSGKSWLDTWEEAQGIHALQQRAIEASEFLYNKAKKLSDKIKSPTLRAILFGSGTVGSGVGMHLLLHGALQEGLTAALKSIAGLGLATAGGVAGYQIQKELVRLHNILSKSPQGRAMAEKMIKAALEGKEGLMYNALIGLDKSLQQAGA